MAKTKLAAASSKRLKAIGIEVATEEEARKKLIKLLAENELEGMDDEDIDTLIDIAESFETTEQSEEEENDELAEEEEDEDEEEEDEDEEEEEEEEKPAKKAPAKKETAPAKKKKAEPEPEEEEDEDEEEEEKPAKKASSKKEAPAKKDAPKADDKKAAPAKKSQKLNPKDNEEDQAYFKPLHKIFSPKDFAYSWVASSGVTIKFNGANGARGAVLIENCSLQVDKSVKCNLFLLTFAKKTDILDEKGIDYEICWSGAPILKGITIKEAVEILTALEDSIKGDVQKIDKKLGDNRKKMEENLNKGKATSKTDPAKGKKVDPEPEPEEEEEDEDEGDEFDALDRTELKAYIKEQGFEISIKKSMSDDDIRDEIRTAVEEAAAAAKKSKKGKK